MKWLAYFVLITLLSIFIYPVCCSDTYIKYDYPKGWPANKLDYPMYHSNPYVDLINFYDSCLFINITVLDGLQPPYPILENASKFFETKMLGEPLLSPIILAINYSSGPSITMVRHFGPPDQVLRLTVENRKQVNKTLIFAEFFLNWNEGDVLKNAENISNGVYRTLRINEESQHYDRITRLSISSPS